MSFPVFRRRPSTGSGRRRRELDFGELSRAVERRRRRSGTLAPALLASAVVLAGCDDWVGQGSRDTAAQEVPEGAPPAPARAEPVPAVPSGPVRRPAVAGGFYPGDADTLRAKVRGYLDAAEKVELPGRLLAVIGPHAGYDYSGPVAGWAHRQLEGLDAETVVLVGGHASRMSRAHVWAGSYRTSLGLTIPDQELVQRLRISRNEFGIEPVGDNPGFHRSADHALEVHVPFLQVALPRARIVPVYFNNPDPQLAARVGEGIARAMRGKKAVIVCSTDLSHYPPAEIAEAADRAILEAIVSLDPARIVEEDQRLLGLYRPKREQCTVCCLGAVLATVEAAKALGATGARVLRYDHSGNRLRKDRSRVVGYAAVAIYGAGPHRQAGAKTAGGEKMAEDSDRMFTDEERKELLALARKSVETKFGGKGLPRPAKMSPAFEMKTGAFVTLHKGGRLRGCIGTFDRSQPVWEVVGEFARRAAFNDSRFPQVEEEEVAEIEFEISVLSPLKKIENPLDIRLGIDGIWLVGSGGERGTYLPQVATETGWSKEKFLSSCASSKAGMPPDAWRDPDRCTVQTYTAEVFSEGGD